MKIKFYQTIDKHFDIEPGKGRDPYLSCTTDITGEATW